MLLAEVDAPECEPLTFYIEAPLVTVEQRPYDNLGFSGTGLSPARTLPDGKGGRKGGGKGGKGGNPGHVETQAKDELPVPATIAVPPEAAGAGLIIVINGHLLRETASLSSIISAVCGTDCSSMPVPVFHLATDTRQVMLETTEQLSAVNAALSADGRANTTVELQDQPGVPAGAVLLSGEGASPALPQASELPAIVNFKLRVPSLGLITRLRDRYGCTISEVFYSALRSVVCHGSQKQ